MQKSRRVSSRLRAKLEVTNLVICEGKQLLPQSVTILFLPLLGQEHDDFILSSEESVAIAPDRVLGISILHN